MATQLKLGVYEKLGVKPVVNGWGTITRVGGTLPRTNLSPPKTRIDWSISLATYNSPVSGCSVMFPGQFIWLSRARYANLHE